MADRLPLDTLPEDFARELDALERQALTELQPSARAPKSNASATCRGPPAFTASDLPFYLRWEVAKALGDDCGPPGRQPWWAVDSRCRDALAAAVGRIRANKTASLEQQVGLLQETLRYLRAELPTPPGTSPTLRHLPARTWRCSEPSPPAPSMPRYGACLDVARGTLVAVGPVAAAGCRMAARASPHRLLHLRLRGIGEGGGRSRALRLSHGEWQRVRGCLVDRGLWLCGRRYRFLHAKWQAMTVVMVAEEGPGLSSLPAASLHAWHIPPCPCAAAVPAEAGGRAMEGANSSPLTRSCPLPLWRYRENAGMHCWLRRARMDLAFTDSRPGTEGCRLVHVPDARGRAGAIMTDGCGFLSAAVMRAAWSALDGTGPVPCALQGRLGGCKGVWVALPDGCMAYPPDRHWVAERPSQRKVHLPTPSPEQQVLEVKRFGKRGAGWLNPQVALALQARGVPPSTFSGLASRTAARLHACLHSPAAAASATQQGLLRCLSRTSAGECLLTLLAQGGVTDGTAAHIARRAVQASAHRMAHRCGVFLERSARLLLVPDPTGTLRPGQAYLRPNAEGPCVCGPVVAARNPCLDPQEVVLLQTVDGARHPVLESLWGVLVLSVRGLASDAGRMGGGDFDGDDALVIWEPELVGKVEAGGEGKQGSGEEEEEGGEERDGPSGQLAALEAQLEGTPAPTRPEPACASDDDSGPAACFEAWRQSFSHNELGRLTRLHLAIADAEGADEDSAREVAALCTQFVDVPKTGRSPAVPPYLQRLHLPAPHWTSGDGDSGSVRRYRRSTSAVAHVHTVGMEALQALAPRLSLPAVEPDAALVAFGRRVCAAGEVAEADQWLAGMAQWSAAAAKDAEAFGADSSALYACGKRMWRRRLEALCDPVRGAVALYLAAVQRAGTQRSVAVLEDVWSICGKELLRARA